MILQPASLAISAGSGIRRATTHEGRGISPFAEHAICAPQSQLDLRALGAVRRPFPAMRFLPDWSLQTTGKTCKRLERFSIHSL